MKDNSLELCAERRAQLAAIASSERGHSCPHKLLTGRALWSISAEAFIPSKAAADKNVRAPLAVATCAPDVKSKFSSIQRICGRGIFGILGVALAGATLSAAEMGRYEPNWASLDQRPTPGVVSGRQVRHVHPLGCLFGSGLGRCQANTPSGIGTTSHDQQARQRLVAVPPGELRRGLRLPGLRAAVPAELFDAKQWADLFARAGVKYIVPTSKHHEGFCVVAQRRGEPHLGPALECRRRLGQSATCSVSWLTPPASAG